MKEIKVFGFGDQRTRQLLAHLHAALALRPPLWRVVEVADVRTILDSEVMAIPALEIDGRIVLEGTESTVEAVGQMLDVAQSAPAVAADKAHPVR